MDERLILMKNYFSLNQTYLMYCNDYIETNLKNVLLSGDVIGKFIPLKDLNLQKDVVNLGWGWHEDQWLKETKYNKLDLGKSIIKNGTYYPITVSKIKNDDKLYVFEGNHRIMSLKMLVMTGEIDENFKMFCLILPTNFETYSEYCNHRNSVFAYRDIMVHQHNFDKILDNKIILNILHNQAKLYGDKMINDYVIEKHTNNCFDILFAMTGFSKILRDLLYIYKEIKPSKIINDEQEYKKWITI